MRSANPPPLPYQKTQPRSQGSLLPVPTEGEPGNDVAKNTEFVNKPFNRKIRFEFQMQQTFPGRKFRNFEYPLEDVCICGNIRGGRRNLSLA